MLSDAAFERELERARPALTRFALRVVKGRMDEALDLVQDVMLRAWRKRDIFLEGAKVSTWLCAILVYRHRTLLKNASRQPRTVCESELPDEASIPALALVSDRHFVEGIHSPEIWEALEKLPPEFAEALWLFEVEGMTLQEVAAIQGAREGTIKSRLHRARRPMADMLAHLN